MEDERAAWNQRYRERTHGSREPDPFLVRAYEEFIEPMFPRPGLALDVGGGTGRHAIWLAQRSWKVELVDISDIGVGEARKNAGELAERIRFRVADLKELALPKRQYDLVLVFFYLERSILQKIGKAVRAGGLLVFKTYTWQQTKFGGGPSHPMHLLDENELLLKFSRMQILYYNEMLRDRGVAEFVGRKR